MRLSSSEFVEWMEFLRLVNETPEQRAMREAKERSVERRAASGGVAPAEHVPAAGSLL